MSMALNAAQELIQSHLGETCPQTLKLFLSRHDRDILLARAAINLWRKEAKERVAR